MRNWAARLRLSPPLAPVLIYIFQYMFLIAYLHSLTCPHSHALTHSAYDGKKHKHPLWLSSTLVC